MTRTQDTARQLWQGHKRGMTKTRTHKKGEEDKGRLHLCPNPDNNMTRRANWMTRARIKRLWGQEQQEQERIMRGQPMHCGSIHNKGFQSLKEDKAHTKNMNGMTVKIEILQRGQWDLSFQKTSYQWFSKSPHSWCMCKYLPNIFISQSHRNT